MLCPRSPPHQMGGKPVARRGKAKGRGLRGAAMSRSPRPRRSGHFGSMGAGGETGAAREEAISGEVGDGEKAAAADCSICLEVLVAGGGERSTVRLQCGHEFHLDCVGSAFNFKGLMQCPYCREIENGKWLFANLSRVPEDVNMGQWPHDAVVNDVEMVLLDEPEYVPDPEPIPSWASSWMSSMEERISRVEDEMRQQKDILQEQKDILRQQKDILRRQEDMLRRQEDMLRRQEQDKKKN